MIQCDPSLAELYDRFGVKMRLAVIAGLLIGTACPAGALAQSALGPAPVMIFFDWGKLEIQRDYATALDAAIQAYDHKAGAVSIVGHSDRSGPAPANLRSSRLRAEVVRDYLVARGISPAAIKVSAMGEQNPYIPTPDGVREAQNRRVDIRFLPVAPAKVAEH